MFKVSAIRAYLQVESDAPITFYTGKLVKTILYALFKPLRLYRGIRGIISFIHVSPLFRPGKHEWELGDLVTPYYARDEEGGYRLVPANLDGEYIVHIGGVPDLVGRAGELLDQLRTPLQLKIGENIVRVKLEKKMDVTGIVAGKELATDRVTLYLKGPAKLFNVFTPTRLPKYNISAVEVLMTPYMLHTGQPTMSENLLLQASRILGLLVETYYSITTVKYIQVPLGSAKDPGITGKITYIVDTRNPETRKKIAEILNTAELAGIGESRANGFGTTTWTTK